MDQNLRVFKDDVYHLPGRQLRCSTSFFYSFKADSLRHSRESADINHVIERIARGNFVRNVFIELDNGAIDAIVFLEVDHLPDLIEGATTTRQHIPRLAHEYLQTRLADTFQRYSNARYQVERYTAKGGILDNARRTMELIRTGYQVEEFGVLELLTAQRTYFQTNLAYLDSLREFWTAAMQIQGLLLKGSLAQRS